MADGRDFCGVPAEMLRGTAGHLSRTVKQECLRQ